MSVAIITGSAGLVGSESVNFLYQKGFEIIGIDNNLREVFFGKEGGTNWLTKNLVNTLPGYIHYSIDIRDKSAIDVVFEKYGKNIALVIHTAAQPSHDWAAKEPLTDFSINATGTLVLLEAVRKYCPQAVFIFTSTNKVYGDTPNTLPLNESKTRWEIESQHPYYEYGINELMSLDQSKHSLMGVSKVAADLLTQEYGRYFGLKTGIFRAGCLTGGAHSGTEMHGFLWYLTKCTVTGNPYTIYGYKGKQVRDNLHSFDLVNAFWHFFQKPKMGSVYNIGGSRYNHCSIIEAIQIIEDLCGRKLNYTVSDIPRKGDHIWWVSDVRKFQHDYSDWVFQYDLRKIIKDILEAIKERLHL